MVEKLDRQKGEEIMIHEKAPKTACKWRKKLIAIILCSICLISSTGILGAYAFSEEYEEGYQDGYNEGLDRGYEQGEKAGYESGLNIGYQNGYMTGNSDGYQQGKKEGYEEGAYGAIVGILKEYDCTLTITTSSGQKTEKRPVIDYVDENGFDLQAMAVDIWGTQVYTVNGNSRITAKFTTDNNNIPFSSETPIYTWNALEVTANYYTGKNASGTMTNATIAPFNPDGGGNSTTSQWTQIIAKTPSLSFVYSATAGSTILNGTWRMFMFNEYGQGFNEGYGQGIQQGEAQGAFNYKNSEEYKTAIENAKATGYANGYNKGAEEAGSNNLYSLMFGIFDGMTNVFKNILNFEVLGVNILAFVGGLIFLLIVIIIIKKVWL